MKTDKERVDDEVWKEICEAQEYVQDEQCSIDMARCEIERLILKHRKEARQAGFEEGRQAERDAVLEEMDDLCNDLRVFSIQRAKEMPRSDFSSGMQNACASMEERIRKLRRNKPKDAETLSREGTVK